MYCWCTALHSQVHAQYEEHYRRYCQLYPALKETFRTGTLHKKKANGQPAADIPAAESNGGDGGANGGDASTALQSGGQQQQAAAAEDRGGDSSGGNKRKREQGLQGRLAPSILAADFSRLAEEVEKVLAAGMCTSLSLKLSTACACKESATGEGCHVEFMLPRLSPLLQCCGLQHSTAGTNPGMLGCAVVMRQQKLSPAYMSVL
jgi:hypothetical protein